MKDCTEKQWGLIDRLLDNTEVEVCGNRIIGAMEILDPNFNGLPPKDVLSALVGCVQHSACAWFTGSGYCGL
jgi:hypothetical protein